MTESDKIVDWARSQIGIAENPLGSNTVIYNTLYYGRAVSGDAYPWCMAFVWCAFDQCGLSRLFYDGKKTASCTTLMKWSKNKGLFHDSGFKVGDIVFYDWDGDPYSEHTGIIVEARSDTDLRVVEGNCSDMVKLTTPKRSTILGVFRPQYAEEEQVTTCTPTMPILKRGAKGIPVWSLQNLLVKRGYSVGRWGCDGDFGADTESAVKKFQTDKKITADGICGGKTWTELYK